MNDVNFGSSKLGTGDDRTRGTLLGSLLHMGILLFESLFSGSPIFANPTGI